MRALFVGLLVSLSLVATSAQAKVGDVTFSFVAKVSRVGRPVTGLAVKVGDEIRGNYTFNIKTRDSQRSNPKVGDYMHRQAPYGVTLTVNGVTMQTDPAAVQFLIELVNDANPDAAGVSYDHYVVRSYKNTSSAARVKVSHISWQLDDPTHANLTNKRLTRLLPKLASWQSPFGLTVTGCDANRVDPSTNDCQEGGQLLFRAEVTSIKRRTTPQ